MAEIVAFRAKMRALDQRLVGHALRVSQVERFAKTLHHKSGTFERNVCARHTFW